MLQLLALLSVHRLPVVLLAPLVAVGPLEARLALQPRTRFLAVRADLEADVALDLVLALIKMCALLILTRSLVLATVDIARLKSNL